MFRIFLPLISIFASLLSLESIRGEFCYTEIEYIKVTLPLLIIILTIVSLSKNIINLWISIVYFILFWYNIGSIIRGESDCGCFPIEVDPKFTAGFDLIMTYCFLWKIKTKILHGHNVYYSFSRNTLLLIPLYLVALVVGWIGVFRINNENLWIEGQYLSDINQDCTDYCFIIYKTGCPKCERYITSMREIYHSQIQGNKNVIEIDVSKPTPEIENNIFLNLTGKNRFFLKCKKSTVPLVITVVNGQIKEIDDWSKMVD